MSRRMRSYGLSDSEENVALRKEFIKKVYIKVLLQLVSTIFAVGIVVGIPLLRQFHVDHAILVLVPATLFLMVALLFIFFVELRHTEPYKYICIIAYTILLTYVMFFAASQSTIENLILSAAAAVLLCGTIFVANLFIEGCDFTGCHFILLFGVLVLVILIITYSLLRNIIILITIGCLGIVVYVFNFIFHNQLTLVNQCKYAYHIDEHYSAAMAIYFDVVAEAFFLGLTIYAVTVYIEEEE